MPIWLRKFTYEKIKKHYEDQKEVSDKANKKLSSKSDPKKISRPDINPNYTVKAPKK